MDDLRCITLRQPYASLVAASVKRWETRSWKTSYRGPLAIHAGMRWEPGWRNIWVDPDRDGPELERYDILIEQLGLEPTEDVNGSGYWAAWDGGLLPVGAVVAVAQLTDCLPIVKMGEADPYEGHDIVLLTDRGRLWVDRWDIARWGAKSQDITDQIPYGNWEPGNWAWKLDDIRPLAEPIPAKGKERLWRPDPDLAAAVTEGNQP